VHWNLGNEIGICDVIHGSLGRPVVAYLGRACRPPLCRLLEVSRPPGYAAAGAACGPYSTSFHLGHAVWLIIRTA
jgi:hypothetical protein